eukprot:5789138-Prorocentrum_lima.AAC.1
MEVQCVRQDIDIRSGAPAADKLAKDLRAENVINSASDVTIEVSGPPRPTEMGSGKVQTKTMAKIKKQDTMHG